MYRFVNGNDYVEIDIGYFDDESEKGKAVDLEVALAFRINGFCGKGASYMLARQMQVFAAEIVGLEKTRRGGARLVHAAGELSFEIRSLDRLGHMGILCRVTEYGHLGPDYLPFEASAFMEISPEQLAAFARQWWVTVYGG